MPQPLYALWERPQHPLMEVQWTPKVGLDTMEKRKLWFLCCLAQAWSLKFRTLPFLQCSVYCQEHNFQNCTFSLWSLSTKNLIQPHIFQWYDCKTTIFNETGPQQHLSWFLFCAVQKCTAVLCFNSSFSVWFPSLFLKATFVLQTKRSA
jgi:hypothetical protein